MIVKCSVPFASSDPCLWRHEPWVGWKWMAAQPGSAPIPFLFHGVIGGCSHAWPPDKERAERPTEDGGQFPQVAHLSLPTAHSLLFAEMFVNMCFCRKQSESALWYHVFEALELRQERAGEEEGWKSTSEPRWVTQTRLHTHCLCRLKWW